MATNANSRLTSGGEVYIASKPVVRVAALSGIKRTLTPAQTAPPTYQMIQIGGDVYKVATIARTGDDTNVGEKQSQVSATYDRKYFGDMAEGAPTTMVISKSEKDDSNDSFASDEASDLSLQLEDSRCLPSNTSSSALTAIVQGPDGQFFVPVHAMGSSDLSSGTIEEVTRKRELRLLKNREAAKECRRKKKDYVRCLENRVALLENQNKTLINELKSLKELYCQKEAQS